MKKQKKCPRGTRVQTLLFDRTAFTPIQAKRWAEEHDFKGSKTDVKPNTIRVRQKDPKKFTRDSFRVIRFSPSVRAVIGCPRTGPKRRK